MRPPPGLEPGTVDDVRALVDRASQHPDFTTFVPATETDIATAEAALGIAFPPHHRALLQESNGLITLRGKTNWFGVGQSAVVDIVEFNRPDGWMSKLPAGWLRSDGVVWVGARYDHTLVGLRGDQGVFVSLLERAHADPHPTTVAFPLTRGLAGLLDRGVKGVQDAPWRQVVKEIGGLGLDEGVVLGPRHYLDGYDDTSSVRATPLASALRIAADLSADVERLDDGDQVLGMEPWIDDGIARTRWVTTSGWIDHRRGVTGSRMACRSGIDGVSP